MSRSGFISPGVEVIATITSMADPAKRQEAAAALANSLDSEDLIIFIQDDEIGRLLPAPGFPQTLIHGKQWTELLAKAVSSKTAAARFEAVKGRNLSVRAFAAADGSVLALMAGHDLPENTESINFTLSLLPLLTHGLNSEVVARRAAARADLARQTAAQATALAGKLDQTRGDLRKALDIAEAATRTRDEFLATVSHELRTPLTSIIGWSQLLSGTGADQTTIAEGMDMIGRNARTQSRLIEDILDFSRINAGKLRLEVQPVDLTDVIRDAVEVVRPGAEAKGIRVVTVLDPQAAAISGDPDRLQQVLWNLLSNSVKFTPKDGQVQLRLERVDSHIEIVIVDSGEGISPEFLPYVFDRFSQADGSSTRTHTGLGLGLGIVKHLVELHGGSIEALSDGLGKGATFIVRLPTLGVRPQQPLENSAPDEKTEKFSSPDAGHFPDLSGVTVLVVEDNDDVRELLTRIFVRCHAIPIPVPGVQEALKVLQSQHPDVLVSDIEMPGEDGYSLIRKIRESGGPSALLPAIALTAYTRPDDRIKALDAGFQTHLGKPVAPNELALAVRNLVRNLKPS